MSLRTTARDAAQEVVTAANPPRAARASCCVKNGQPAVDFLGRVAPLPTGPAIYAGIPDCSVPPHLPRGRLKNLSTNQTGNTRPSRAEAMTRGGWPSISAVGSDFDSAYAPARLWVRDLIDAARAESP